MQVNDLTALAGDALANNSASLARPGYIGILGDTPGAAVLGSWVGNWMGIPVFSSTNVPTANAGEDRGGALFVAKEALGLAIKWDVRIETQRLASKGLGGSAIWASMAYKAGELRDALGVSIITDA